MIEDDDRPVTMARLANELESLRLRIDMERLERERKALFYWQAALAILIWTTIVALMISSLINKGIH
jgi:hypothetical protein